MIHNSHNSNNLSFSGIFFFFIDQLGDPEEGFQFSAMTINTFDSSISNIGPRAIKLDLNVHNFWYLLTGFMLHDKLLFYIFCNPAFPNNCLRIVWLKDSTVVSSPMFVLLIQESNLLSPRTAEAYRSKRMNESATLSWKHNSNMGETVNQQQQQQQHTLSGLSRAQQNCQACAEPWAWVSHFWATFFRSMSGSK